MLDTCDWNRCSEKRVSAVAISNDGLYVCFADKFGVVWVVDLRGLDGNETLVNKKAAPLLAHYCSIITSLVGCSLFRSFLFFNAGGVVFVGNGVATCLAKCVVLKVRDPLLVMSSFCRNFHLMDGLSLLQIEILRSGYLFSLNKIKYLA